MRRAVLELERRFRVLDSSLSRLLRHEPVAPPASFLDIYYDQRDTFPLTRKNVWLRTRHARDAPPELVCKIPLQGSSAPHSGGISVELEDEQSVAAYCRREHLSGVGPASTARLPSVIERLRTGIPMPRLDAFSVIRTERTTYHVDGTHVVVDKATFHDARACSLDGGIAALVEAPLDPLGSYSIGEIEVAAEADANKEADADVQAGLSRIARAAAALDIELVDDLPPKIVQYLWQIDRRHYETLRECDVISQTAHLLLSRQQK